VQNIATACPPDALTGMEANLHFADKETMETRIFGRSSRGEWLEAARRRIGSRS